LGRRSLERRSNPGFFCRNFKVTKRLKIENLQKQVCR
jgi:hypothetical protein